MIESYQWEGSEKKVMKKLYYLLRMTIKTKFSYIKAFWINIFGTAVSILIYYFLWKYVFQSSVYINGFT